MSGHRVAAITRRLLQGFRRDRRTLALLFVAPLVILGLLGYMLRNSATPAVGVVNEDSGPLGAVVASALDGSTKITTTNIAASDGDAKLKDGLLTVRIPKRREFRPRKVEVRTDARKGGSPVAAEPDATSWAHFQSMDPSGNQANREKPVEWMPQHTNIDYRTQVIAKRRVAEVMT